MCGASKIKQTTMPKYKVEEANTMKGYMIAIISLSLLIPAGPFFDGHIAKAATTIHLRPTGEFHTDRDTVQDAIDNGFDEIVLLSKTEGGLRVDWNFGGAPTATPMGDKVALPFASPAIDPRTFGANADDISGISQNLIIRGETIPGKDKDGDPDYVVLDGAALWYAWTSGGFPFSFPHPNGGNYNLTVRNLHFKNSPGAAIGLGSNGDVLIEDCKISTPRQVNFFSNSWLRPIISYGSFQNFGIPDFENWMEVFPKGNLVIRNCIIDATMEYSWNDLIHEPGNINSIGDQYEVGIHMNNVMNSSVLIENNIVMNANAVGISISNPIIPENDPRATRSVIVKKNKFYTKDYGPSEVFYWFVGFCNDPDNPNTGTGFTPATSGIEINLRQFPKAPAMPVIVEHNHIVTKGFQDTGVQVMGPINGLEIRKNTIDSGPSKFTGMDGYNSKASIMITSTLCSFHPLVGPITDPDGYGAQNILIEKNKLRGTANGGVAVRGWEYWIWPLDDAWMPFTDIRIIKNDHKFIDHSFATYFLAEPTHDCYLRAKPPKQNLEILDFGENNIIKIPGNSNP